MFLFRYHSIEMGQSFIPVLVRVSDLALVAKCAAQFLDGSAIEEYTPEGCVWVEAGNYGSILRATDILRQRLRTRYDGGLWYIVTNDVLDVSHIHHLPRLDMNLDFLKRSLEIDVKRNYDLECLKIDLYICRDNPDSDDVLYGAIKSVVDPWSFKEIWQVIGNTLSPLTTVLKSDGTAIWMWGAYSGDLSVEQVQQIRSDPEARAFKVKAYHPFGKAAAYWRMIRNHVIQRRVFFYWMELPAKGSKREADMQEAVTAYELGVHITGQVEFTLPSPQ